MSKIPKEIMEGARNGRDWYEAYLAVGFNEEQALQLVCRPIFTQTMPVYQQSPEMSEVMSKVSVMLDRGLAE